MGKSREEKYKDTPTFKFYNANPLGKYTTDCVVRAISTGIKEDYNKVLVELVSLQIQYGYAISDSKLYNKYLQSKGFVKMPQPRHMDNTKYTGSDWCEKLTEKYPNGEIGRIIAHIGGGHVVCIAPVKCNDAIKYKVLDTWYSQSGSIGNYWVDNNLYK